MAKRQILHVIAIHTLKCGRIRLILKDGGAVIVMRHTDVYSSARHSRVEPFEETGHQLAVSELPNGGSMVF